MKNLKIFGLSFLVASAISFVWASIIYEQYQMWLEMIQKQCQDRPCMMPINTSMDDVHIRIVIGIILSIIGIVLLIINHKRRDMMTE